MKMFKIISLALLSLSLVYSIRPITYNSFQDFSVYYYSTVSFLNGTNPYIASELIKTPPIYPPSFFVFFSPLTTLPLEISQKIFFVLSLMSLLLSFYLCYKVFEVKSKYSFFVLISIFLLYFFPIKFTFGMGQINNFILLFISLFLFLISKRKNYLGGISLGMAISLKLFPLLLLMYLIFRRKVKVILFSLGTFILISLIALLFVNSNIYSYYLREIFPGLFEAKNIYYNQSFTLITSALIKDVFLFRFVNGVIIFIGLLILGGIIYLKKSKLIPACLAILTFSVLFNSFSWQHHFTWLIPSFLYVFNLTFKKDWKLFSLTFLSFILVGFNLSNPNSFPFFITPHVFYGGLILLVTQLFLLNKNLSR